MIILVGMNLGAAGLGLYGLIIFIIGVFCGMWTMDSDWFH